MFLPFDLRSTLQVDFLSSQSPMAHPQEVAINSIGLTVLNPELSPDEALVEYVPQPCGD